VNPPRNRKDESGNPLPKANASEFYPNQNTALPLKACNGLISTSMPKT